MHRLSNGVAALGVLLAAAACDATHSEASAPTCSVDGSVSDGTCRSDAGSVRTPEGGVTQYSCFRPDGSCWENTSNEGAEAILALCDTPGVAENVWSCSAFGAPVLYCTDEERHLRQVFLFTENAEPPACAGGLVEEPGIVTPALVESCDSMIRALGPRPPPDCHASTRTWRTDLERCVDALAWLDPVCGECVLANATWVGGAGVDPNSGVVDCTYLRMGDTRRECADACAG